MHEVKIPQAILDACIRLRGRVHAFESIEPERTALLVIDMQNAWVEAGLSPLEIPETRTIIPNINKLAEAVRAAGGIVAWTQSVFDEDWTRQIYQKFGPPEWRERIIADSKVGGLRPRNCRRHGCQPEGPAGGENAPQRLHSGIVLSRGGTAPSGPRYAYHHRHFDQRML